MNKYFFNNNLSSFLGISDSRIITFVGGGGKTSLMNTLGKEFASQGIPTLLTTTTHIMKPDFLPDEAYIEEENFKQLTDTFTSLRKEKIPLAALGLPHQMINNRLKWRSPSVDFCKKVAAFSSQDSDFPLRILCEGDGSKRLPVKIPKKGEPVLFPKTDTVIGVIGLSCLGKPIKEILFRHTLLKEILPTDNFLSEISFYSNYITTDFLYWLCLSEKGLRKNTTLQNFCIILNQADTLDSKMLASVIELRNSIREQGICCHIVSQKYGYIII